MSPDKAVRAENKDKLQSMKDYATNTIMCRRKMILEYFEEQYDPFNCGNCDNCVAILNNSNHAMQDLTEVRAGPASSSTFECCVNVRHRTHCCC